MQLGRTAETVTFGCKMVVVDQENVQRTLAIMMKELEFLKNVLGS